MKDYDKNKELSYLKYWDLNSLCCWVMPQELSKNDFNWVEQTSKFNENFIKSYNDESDEEHLFEIDVQYPENLNNLQNDLPFLPEILKCEKFEELVANLHDKEEYVINIKILKQALNHGLTLFRMGFLGLLTDGGVTHILQ